MNAKGNTVSNKSYTATVATGRLKIDPLYQRPLDERRVERMAGEWSPMRADAITVSARNGSWYVIDGQHRLAAARAAGVSELFAVVHEGMSPAEEAALFVDLNTLQRRPDASAVFAARIEAGDEDAIDVMRICGRHGIVPDLKKSGGAAKRPEVTRAVAALLVIYRAGGPDVLDLTAQTLRTAWPDDPRGLDAPCFYGVASFIFTYRAHPRYRFERIAAKLAERSAGAFINRARDLTTASISGGNGALDKGVFQKAGPRRAVLEAFNRNLQFPLPDATLRDFRALAQGRNPWDDEQ